MTIRKKGLLLAAAGLLLAGSVWPFRLQLADAAVRTGRTLLPHAREARSVGAVLTELGPRARPAWEAACRQAGAPYPPRRLTLAAFKAERKLEVWAPTADGRAWRRLRTYPFTAGSGESGPKLREGDGQIPEGFYGIDILNPNSKFHLSMRVNYPNAFDRRMAARDGRTRLGGDIYIHGGAASIGCIPVGDASIDELFWLTGTVGKEKVAVIIAPCDLRNGSAVAPAPDWPPWVPDLHAAIRAALASFPTPKEK